MSTKGMSFPDSLKKAIGRSSTINTKPKTPSTGYAANTAADQGDFKTANSLQRMGARPEFEEPMHQMTVQTKWMKLKKAQPADMSPTSSEFGRAYPND